MSSPSITVSLSMNNIHPVRLVTLVFVCFFLQEVETLTAHWSLYISLAGFSVGLLVVPLLGSWSDFAGRRPVLIIPNLGMAVQVVVYLVVMYLKLPVVYFLVGRILSGLSGDFNAILAGCFAYVADTSDRRSRTFRVAVLEACIGISGMLASIIGGQWRQAQGYEMCDVA